MCNESLSICKQSIFLCKQAESKCQLIYVVRYKNSSKLVLKMSTKGTDCRYLEYITHMPRSYQEYFLLEMHIQYINNIYRERERHTSGIRLRLCSLYLIGIHIQCIFMPKYTYLDNIAVHDWCKERNIQYICVHIYIVYMCAYIRILRRILRSIRIYILYINVYVYYAVHVYMCAYIRIYIHQFILRRITQQNFKPIDPNLDHFDHTSRLSLQRSCPLLCKHTVVCFCNNSLVACSQGKQLAQVLFDTLLQTCIDCLLIE